MTATADPDMILLGRVSGLFGVKGWIKVYSDTEPRDNILNYSPWYLQREGEWRPYEVIGGRPHGKGIVAQLANCPDRDAAAELIHRPSEASKLGDAGRRAVFTRHHWDEIVPRIETIYQELLSASPV